MNIAQKKILGFTQGSLLYIIHRNHIDLAEDNEMLRMKKNIKHHARETTHTIENQLKESSIKVTSSNRSKHRSAMKQKDVTKRKDVKRKDVNVQ